MYKMTNFSNEVQMIERDLLSMGEEVLHQMENVKDVFFIPTKDANVVIQQDESIDAFDHQIHTSILHLISLQQPLPEELRTLTTMMRMAREFERIGDQVVNVAELKKELDVDDLRPYVSASFVDGYKEMLQVSTAMLTKTLEGMRAGTPQSDKSVEQMDEDVDALFFSLQQRIIRDMKETPDQIEKLAPLFLAIRYVERMADHVVNIQRRKY
ncbi:phosphate signaling complex protein PhoU [Salicibibacter cibarius]|uniref:Phosphate signaling complex protein PhoU n=1 Tax=Salicibibacter cibarius TaxID=2743000 RepID=A0A7T7CCR8_9BACI|nr:phosphate signaling complex protein PhoU [Salicibibacter cibarius]QQK77252.1 phosphate signaling complex protein PhoU [Salicibibacter cibarius]